MIQEEAEKIAQVVTVMAHQGTRYTLEKQVFVQASPRRTKLAGTVYAEGLFCGRRSGKRPAWQTLWQQANT